MTWTALRTWLAGAVVPGAALNTDLRDNLLHLYDQGTVTPALLGTWLQYGGALGPVTLTRRGDIVYMSGGVKSGAAASNIFTIPVGYRPTDYMMITCAANIGSASIQINWTTGMVTHIAYFGGGTNAFIDLECSWPVV